MNAKLEQAYMLQGLQEARDVLDSRIAEIEDTLGLVEEGGEDRAGESGDPLVQNAAAARKALAQMREEYRNLGGTGIFTKSKLEALRRRAKSAASKGGGGA